MGIGDWGLGIGVLGVWCWGPNHNTHHPPPQPKTQQKNIIKKNLF